MQYWFLIVVLTVVSSAQSVFTRLYNRKLEATVENSSLFTLARVMIIAVFFLIMSGFQLQWHEATFPYALSYGLMLAINLIATTMAFMLGPFALTTLIISSSLALVTIYGIVFLREAVTWKMGIGLALLAGSLLLLHEKQAGGYKLTGRWWAYTIAAFFCNAGCTISQRMHQEAFPGLYQNEFMLWGSILCGALCLAYCVMKRVNLQQTRQAVKMGGWPMLGVGVSCALVNLLLLKLNATVPATILFPTWSGLGLLAAALLGKFAYHEKSSRNQKLSFALGVCAVILLN